MQNIIGGQRYLVFQFFRVVWLAICFIPLAAQTPESVIQLEPGKPQERDLAVGQGHFYKISLQAGQCARFEVEQRGINVLLNVSAPDGSFLLFVDNQRNTQGVEEGSLVAATTGDYRLWVGVQASPQAKNIPPGKYEVRLAELHAATATDQLRYDATQAYSDMLTQGQKTNAEAQQHMLRAAEAALRLFEELKDYHALVATRVFLLSYFQRLSDKSKAMENLACLETLLPKLNNPKAQAERLIQNGVTYRSLYEWQRALTSYEQAYRQFEAIADQDGMMRALNSMARIHADTFNYRKVIELRTKTLAYYRAQNARDFSAYLLQEIGRAYRNLGDYDRAFGALQEAQQIYQAIGNKEGAYDTWISLGYLYSLTRRKTEAIDAFEYALSLAQELGFTNEVVQVAVEIGKVYDRSREPAKAAEWLQKAAALPRSPKISRIPEGAVLSMLGEFAFILGKEWEAVEYFQQAVEKAADFDNYFDKHMALSGLGWFYSSIKDFARLHETEQQRLRVVQKSGDKYREAELWRQKAISQMETDLPLDFWQKKDERTTTAAAYLEQSRALLQAANNPNEALSLAHLSIYYAISGDRPKALSYLDRALRLNESLGIYEQRPVKALVSQAYGFLGEQRIALELMRSVTLGLKDLPENEGLYHYYLSARLRASGLLAEAKEHLEKAIEMWESNRSQQRDQLVRTRIFSSFAGLFDEYIDLLQQMHEQQPQQGFDRQAFLASARGHARSLLETMANANVDVRLDADPQLLAREQMLREKINTLAGIERGQQEKKLDASTLAATRKDIDEALEQLRRVQTQIKVSSPRYAAVTQPQPPTLTDVQKQLLDADTLLLSYALGKTRSYLWAITKDSFTSYQLPSRDKLTQATRRVYDLLTVPQRLSGLTMAQQQKQLQEAEQQYQTEAAALSQMLLGPVAAQLGTKRLLIVAPEVLQYLPFGALPDPVAGSQLPVAGKNARADRPPLLKDHEIINLPSVSVMILLRQELAQRKPAPKAVAVLADPVFEANDPRVKAKAATKNETSLAVSPLSPLTRSLRSFTGRAGLARLLLSRDEAEAIASAVPAPERLKVLGFSANRTAATNTALRQFRIVHFATHGLLNAERPELSGLVFSLVDEVGQPQDGFLRLHEIYNLNLPAELIVLSACQTGLGKDIKGEGMIGLTRGFMYAGAARVVASLWRVDDYATSVLMKKFYRGMLQEKLRPAAALRQAQLEMGKQQQWQAPFYWSGFVLQGEWK